MAARKKQGALTRVERALDEYVVEPVKKLVGIGEKRAPKRAAKKPAPGTVTNNPPVRSGGKRKASPTSRAGGATRRTAGTPSGRSAR